MSYYKKNGKFKNFCIKSFLSIATLIQTICGIVAYFYFFNPPMEELPAGNMVPISPFEDPAFMGAFIIVVIFSVLITLIRTGFEYIAILFALIDILLSPVAFLRVFVALIFSSNTRNDLKLDFLEIRDFKDKVMAFLFYIEENSFARMTPVKNLILQIFVTLPFSALLTGSFWLLIASIKNNAGLIAIIISCAAIEVFANFCAYTKTTEICRDGISYTVTHVTSNYKYGNINTYKKGRWVSDDRNIKTSYFETSDPVIFTPNFTAYTIWSIVFSPIMFFTQIIGIIAAVVAIFTDKITSSFGQVDYTFVNHRKLQFFIGFLCNFTISER